jgi:hypothetical protein
MEHLQNRHSFIQNEEEKTDKETEGESIAAQNYVDEQVLFFSKSCSALIDEDDKYMVIAAMMAVFNVNWTEFRDWYTKRYIGR